MALRVAAIQMVSTPIVEENLATAGRWIAEAARQGAELVLLPEYFCIMGMRDTDKVGACEADGQGPIQEFLAAVALRHHLWVIGGTLPLVAPEPGKVLNASMVFDPVGRRVARYDKIHLFSFHKGQEAYDEARTIVAGRETVGFGIDAQDGPFRVGLSICYDLRFPELYRRLGDCALMVVPSAFTYTTGKAHWEVLLRARAIENQCYVLAAAQGGTHRNGRRTWGHSMLIDPWGEIVAVLPEGEGLVEGGIDPASLVAVRANLPALKHRVLSP